MSDLVDMRLFLTLPLVGAFALLLLPAQAHACQGGRTVVSGETALEQAVVDAVIQALRDGQ